jgi:hypothetical protein
VRHAHEDQAAGPSIEVLGHPEIKQSPSEGTAHGERQTRSAEQMDRGHHGGRRSQPAAEQPETLIATVNETKADTYTIQKKEERSYIQEVERH